ncbi:MAG: type I-E CRISPR-associated protein Cas5/CasD [Gammaproteobacteria bacterium]|nr:type I-E CRISPR-associated protein Cas5/CasD [Gammaproteobacteria bacterium]
MKEYLLFHLYGPMAAWGDTAVGEFRPSHNHPTRTAVLGLVAAALGIRRHEEERLQALEQSCLVAVRLDATGEVLRDYHTTQVPPEQRKVRHYTRRDELNASKLHTILSQRDYLTDAAATIALSATDDPPIRLQQMAEALQRPALPLYLGRKSCPLALPLEPRLIKANDLKTAFDAYPPVAEQLKKVTEDLHQYGQGIPAPEQFRYYWEEGETTPGMKTEMIYPCRDRLRNRQRWQFDTRSEHYAAEIREE